MVCCKLADVLAEVWAESPMNVSFLLWYFKMEVLQWKEIFFLQSLHNTFLVNGSFLGFLYIQRANALFCIFHLSRLLLLPVTTESPPACTTVILCYKWDNCMKNVYLINHDDILIHSDVLIWIYFSRDAFLRFLSMVFTTSQSFSKHIQLSVISLW